jgi:hypothetical protein
VCVCVCVCVCVRQPPLVGGRVRVRVGGGGLPASGSEVEEQPG